MAARGRNARVLLGRYRGWFPLVGLLAVAFALRVYGQNWDDGHLFHPDERHILMTTQRLELPWPPPWELLFTPNSPLNPKSFAYGSFPFYLLRATSAFLSGLGSAIPFLDSWRDLNQFGNLARVGRTLSALFDLGAIVVVYLIGTRLYRRSVGLLAAAFVTLSVIHIQLSHFYAVDTPMTFFVMATLLGCVLLVQRFDDRAATFTGGMLGLALASKVSAAPVLSAVAAAYLLWLFSDTRGRLSASNVTFARFAEAIRGAILTGGVAILTFVVAQPYALIDSATFIRHIAEQSAMVRGVADLPYTRQYVNRTDYLYFVQNLSLFGLGLPLGIAAFGGWLWVFVRTLRGGVAHRRRADILLLAWVVPYFLITGSFHAKFTRYLLPITPILCLFAASALLDLHAWLGRWRGRTESARDGVVAANGPLPDSPVADGVIAGAVAQVEPAQPAVPGGFADLDEETRRVAEHQGLGLRFGHAEVSGDAFASRTPRDLSRLTVAEPADEAPFPVPMPAWVARSPALAAGLRSGRFQHVSAAVIGIVLATTLYYALAFVNMYSAPHPAVVASRWVYANVPRGATIATEHWEEGMPVPLVENGVDYSEGSMQYQKLSLNLYENDDPGKLDHIVQQLLATDYIIFFSNRLYGTIPRLPDRYPMTTEYYKLLFGEQLGFELVAAFTSYPNLLDVAFVDDTFSDPGLPTPALLRQTQPSPITLNLGRADESFSVYDHPKVLVFKKTQSLAEAELRAMLEPHLANVTWSGGRASGSPQYKSLMLDPAQQAAVRVGGTFSDLFDRESLSNRAPLITWVLLVEVLGLVAAPLAFLVFRNLADRGYLLAKTLGLLLFTWISWITVSLGIVLASRLTAFAAFGAITLIGLAIAVWQRTAIIAFVRARWRLIALAEAVFWLAFVFFLYIRASNPDLWHPARGGEKPMDIAYLMASIKSATYPPYDPWFAGGYLNYYYYGQLIVGTLIKLSGIVPTTAYNLVVPLLFALTFSGAFAAGFNLIQRSPAASPGSPAPAHARHEWPHDGEAASTTPASRENSQLGRPRTDASARTSPSATRRAQLLAGFAAGLFVCVMGNLGGYIQIAQALGRIGDFGYQSAIPGVGALLPVLVGLVRVLRDPTLLHIPTDWYWPSTRVIEGTINEFPYFTFLYADMHAHMIALPITVFVLALAIELMRAGLNAGSRLAPALLWRATSRLHFTATPLLGRRSATSTDSPTSDRTVEDNVATRLLTLFVTALAVGALMPTNSWDFPTYLGLVTLALLVPWYLSRPLSLQGLVATAIPIVLVAAASVVLYLPFHLNFQSFYSGFVPSPGQSEVDDYLVIHGFFLAVLLSYVVIDVADRHRRNSVVRTLRLALSQWELLPRFLRLRQRLVRRADDATEILLYTATSLLAFVAVLAVLGMALVGILLALLVIVAVLALRRDNRAEETLFYLLFGSGLALGSATELIAIDGDIGRMNTVFKFYLQVWTMWGIATAVALVRLVARLRSLRMPTLRRCWLAALGALTLAGFVYPVVATPARVADRFTTDLPLTLDGTAYMPHAVYVDQDHPIRFAADLAAIRWLQDNVEGTPVILEGNAELYRWGSRVSIYTGLPTVIGWDWHQTQQRWGYQRLVQDRLRDVKTAFTTTSIDQTMELLRKYNVEYVYVGDVERAYYPASGLEKFDAMVGQYLDVVYDADGVKIYRVK